MKLVLVEWVDSSYTQGWRDKSCFKDIGIARCTSVGVLVHENEEKITLVLSSGTDDYADSMTIPKVCVKRIRYLKVE